jgi:uncharacterized hydrophobic protein (TIGR00271 family)
MVHLRIVVPEDLAEQTLDLLCGADAVQNVIHLKGAASKPRGDVILCDVAREDASVILSDLKELDIPRLGSIALEEIDTAISDAALRAEKAAKGLPSDAVVWEEVESRTSENTELGAGFLTFMTIATLIAAVGIMSDSVVLIIGAMVVGPEFGPIAGFCVALVERRRELAKRSLAALAVGFPAAITVTFLFTLLVRETGPAPEDISEARPLTAFISHPDAFSVVVALLAGTAGILSLTSTKSGALVGVLISVTTIPSAANIAVAAAYADWSEWRGAMAQLSVNLVSICAGAVATLFIQRRLYLRRRVKHLSDPARRAAGLPIGHSRRSGRRKTRVAG